jgi:homoserine kinase
LSQSIVVRAPATSANLGPGFDCLGLTLNLWNEVSAHAGAPQDQREQTLIHRAAQTVFDRIGAPYPGFELECTNRIPFARGLGSSAAAIACGLLIANHCLGSPLDEGALLDLATALEGHPDNAVPCLLGGVRVATVADNGRVVQAHVPVAMSLHAVVFVPEHNVPTAHARGLLPSTISRADALFNVARSSLLVAALASGQPELLAEATRDRLHQPYRLALFPAGATLLATAIEAGALGAFTSGAGPSVLALCSGETQARSVGAALDATARRLGEPGQTMEMSLIDRGAYVVA